MEHKWLEHDGNAPFIETRRTPDIENMDPEQYRQSITQLVSALSCLLLDKNKENRIRRMRLFYVFHDALAFSESYVDV